MSKIMIPTVLQLKVFLWNNKSFELKTGITKEIKILNRFKKKKLSLQLKMSLRLS